MSRRERHKRRRGNRGHPLARAVVVTGLVLLATVGLAGLGIVGWIVSTAESAPSIDSLKPRDGGENSVVYAADGSRLGFIQSDILRDPIPGRLIPRSVKRATVAIEDRRYYEHKGVDYTGIVRAAFENIANQKTVQGGSTLTMQLVRNIYIPEDKNRKSYTRKIREAKLAEELEKRHSKRWILNRYLNSVPYGTLGGQNLLGIQAAARAYFDKKAKDLTLGQSALLAGLPQAPSDYNPILNPTGAKARRAQVLRAMVTAGYITEQRAQEESLKPLGVAQSTFYTSRRERFFFDYVRKQLVKRYGEKTVEQGGLKVYTTIDPALQDQARAAIAGQLPYATDPSSAIVSVDPANGRIRAAAASEEYGTKGGKTKFDYATQALRQPGSTFKIMVLMAALDRGISPTSTTYTSKPLPAGWLPEVPGYSVSTYADTYSGSMNLVSATTSSDNTVYAQLIADLGPEAVRQAAYDMGITKKIDDQGKEVEHLNAFYAEGLGGLKYGVTPLEMASAYATIANGGYRIKPTGILKVVHPDGRVDQLGKPKRVKEFTDGATAEATKILKANITSGTGTAANIPCPAAGKTGTTEDFKDAWFVGYTPKLATSVWVGYEQPTPMLSVQGISVAGGTIPAEIWNDYMEVARGDFCGDFPSPEEPFVAQPFYGEYASSGSSGYSGSYDYDGSGSYTPTTPSSTPDTGTQQAPATPEGDTTGTGDYQDPDLYEAPPTPPPTSPPPAPEATGGAGVGE